jgi:hypothetical protein
MNGKKINEWYFGNNMEWKEVVMFSFKVVSLHSLEGTKEKQQKSGHDIEWPGKDSKQARPK